jgi:hypothetical protein
VIITESRHLVADVIDWLGHRVNNAAVADVDAGIAAGRETVAEAVTLFELSLADYLWALADIVRPEES